jgi:hypothetical protein
LNVCFNKHPSEEVRAGRRALLLLVKKDLAAMLDVAKPNILRIGVPSGLRTTMKISGMSHLRNSWLTMDLQDWLEMTVKSNLTGWMPNKGTGSSILMKQV